jgi:hypothetical protein
MRALTFAVALTLLVAPAAHAFVVDAPDGGSGDAVADFAAAARWDMNAGSLVETGERGLGGGLEYAIDDSVCTKLIVVDAPDCAAVKTQIGEAAARWGVGHPAIAFTDVTGKITPALAPETGGWLGHGAEIDFFAISGDALARDHADTVAADTRAYYLFAPAPHDPEGRVQRAARGRVTAADVRFNADMCFYLDPRTDAPGCAHFGSVVMHEMAHVLGLDHPDEHPERNLDTDADPGDSMALGCDGTAARLAAAPRTERYAVANGRWTGAGYWTRGLTYDDYAGRDALYPDCGTVAVAAASGGARRWAAFALSDGETSDAESASETAANVLPGTAFGWARDSVTQDDARQRAEEECARYAGSCTVAAVFTDCFAFARDAKGSWGWAVRDNLASARRDALMNCARNGATCQAPIAMCAAPYEEGEARAGRPSPN